MNLTVPFPGAPAMTRRELREELRVARLDLDYIRAEHFMATSEEELDRLAGEIEAQQGFIDSLKEAYHQ